MTESGEQSTSHEKPTLKQALLVRARDHVLEHGAAGLSLSQLSREVGSSNRMLLYHFGSLEQLLNLIVDDVVASSGVINAVLAPLAVTDRGLVDRLCSCWDVLASDGLAGARALFFAHFGTALQRPDRNAAFIGMVADQWTDDLVEALRAADADVSRTSADAVVALWRGLQMSLISGVDPDVVAATHRRAVAVLIDC